MRGTCAALAAHYMRRERPWMEHLCAMGVDNNNRKGMQEELRAEKETYSIWSWSWSWSWKTMYCCAISLTSDAPENWARIGREWNVRWHWRGMLHRRMLPQRWQVKLIRASIKYEINAEIWYDRSCRVVPRQETGNVLSATWQRHYGRGAGGKADRRTDGQTETDNSCQLPVVMWVY